MRACLRAEAPSFAQQPSVVLHPLVLHPMGLHLEPVGTSPGGRCAGLDYTVAHYGIVTKDPRLDAVLCFVAEQGQDSVWEDGEVRACVCACD